MKRLVRIIVFSKISEAMLELSDFLQPPEVRVRDGGLPADQNSLENLGCNADLYIFNQNATQSELFQFIRRLRQQRVADVLVLVSVTMSPLATSLPFSDHHNRNELPRLPSPNHGDVDVACWDASVSILILMERYWRRCEVLVLVLEEF